MRPADLFALAVASAMTCVPPQPPLEPDRPPPTEAWLDQDELARAGIAIAIAAEHDVNDVLVTPGRVAFDEDRVSHVFSPVSGQVRSIDGELGAPVARGHTLAVIASPDLGQATADLRKAQAALVAVQHAYDRQRQLWQSRATTLVELEQAKDDWRSAQAEHSRAAQKVALFHAGSAVSQTFDLKSPLDGEVLARVVNPGLQVQGIYSGGTSPELFTVGDLEEVWVFSAVHQADFARVRVGAHAEVALVSGDRPFVGFVDWISGALDPQTRTATIRCVIRNRGAELKPEMYGTVTVSATPVRALAIPRESIVRLGGTPSSSSTAVSPPTRVQRFERPSRTADEDVAGDFVPVTHGVELGDHVVTQGMVALSAKMGGGAARIVGMRTISRADAMRASVAGAKAVSVRSSAEVLFQAGGQRVLPAAVQTVVRGAVAREASRILGAKGLGHAVLEAGATTTSAGMVEVGAARAVASQAARAAGRQVLRAVSAAAAAGAVIDGGWALVQAVARVRKGAMTRREAAVHVAREATTGAAATAAGTAAAALLVGLTGGVAAPAIFVVGAAASLGTKAGLDAWLAARARGQIRAVRVA